ncbi:hypothetical protein BY458DRAFT_487672 [Sporodiniella umbellata]|nr:hypothetical protein BY458DRAFT_487669 [Sporodiniella umbellata]KAI9279781.1 hypothetical protein BY458DRAFT_487672 [Sporodiniella umbellata]
MTLAKRAKALLVEQGRGLAVGRRWGVKAGMFVRFSEVTSWHTYELPMVARPWRFTVFITGLEILYSCIPLNNEQTWYVTIENYTRLDCKYLRSLMTFKEVYLFFWFMSSAIDIE